MATQTEIKNIIASQLSSASLTGAYPYGTFRRGIFDGKEERLIVVEVIGATRLAGGLVIVWHPHYGKWEANLLSKAHAGKPRQILTAEEIRAAALERKTIDLVYEVYQIEPPVVKPPPEWDPGQWYWWGQE